MHATTMNYLQPTDAQKETMQHVRDDFSRMLGILEERIPKGRYLSLAVTALEESAMWAMKGVSRDSDGTPRPEAV